MIFEMIFIQAPCLKLKPIGAIRMNWPVKEEDIDGYGYLGCLA